MQRPSLAGLATLALTGGSLLSLASPAQAADATVLYVRQQSTVCSDTGPGTLEQPFCSIAPAAAIVTAGQTVDIGSGTYAERLTVSRSGTPDQPIVFLGSAYATLTGSGAGGGVTIDGQHDIVVQNMNVRGSTDTPALDLRNATDVTIERGIYPMAAGSTAPALRLTGVTRSTLKGVTAIGSALKAGLTMDAATSGVSVRLGNIVSSSSDNFADHSHGIHIEGPGNSVVGVNVNGFTGAAIAVEAGATGTVVANTQISGGAGYGIHNHGATGTAISNNSVRSRCRDGIRVDGASTGVSVQNNVLSSNGMFGQSYCDPNGEPGAEIGLYGDASRDTVADYNNVYHHASPSASAYSWNGTPMGLAAFRTASGQAAHDKDTPWTYDAEDAANSAAPGYPSTDRIGNPRADNPARPDSGAGPVTYADRGPVETLGSPASRFNVALDLGTTSVTVDASASTPGYVPITSYVIDFGDGTVVTQATPVATHRYPATGTYTVSVKVSGSDGRAHDSRQSVTVARRSGTVALLAQSGLRYVAASANAGLIADQAAPGGTAQFDLADIGTGRVALFSRATGRYVTSSNALVANGTWVDTTGWFRLLRNTDGTVSLRSTGSTYVSAPSTTSPLTANATTIGTREKFYLVNVTDADRSLKAKANGRFVTAESGGNRPLIANRTAVGPWERFDIVDLGSGQVALLARANNRFVCAESRGTLPLIANRTAVGAWERFSLVRNSDGTVSLKAAINGRYVTAESGGAKPLIANRTAIGPWEKFTLG
ncbi:PKD domain-containing protein [Micromonospora rhizosphaerae]|uniref:PKD domain-containing protein n=1 Tax=Micromonospora rhizosphaerae TaxID=568872 RepID=A0A1C6RHC7_9ACTN|nr:PKD domain-containing protein [Micromonospora rhizosphaerae]SCL16595.1 PKD domain-containing protein [Micromonospora rhizosphaerae]